MGIFPASKTQLLVTSRNAEKAVYMLSFSIQAFKQLVIALKITIQAQIPKTDCKASDTADESEDKVD